MLHDAIGYAYAAYELDTTVEDLEDRHPPPALPRVATKELTVQIYSMGKWHRRTPDLKHTACGKLIDGQFCPTRPERLEGDLCDDQDDNCFTGFERRQAAITNAKGYEP